jgi:aspartyl-tRNA(Asn)/glutamyl-tRNA(Gln) amidotransferase subunit C
MSDKTLSLDVNYIKNLARLELTDEEVAKFQSQLGEILEHFEAINAVNTDGIEPTSHAFPLENVWREDVPNELFPIQKALMNAPQARRNEFVVPRVVEE